MFLSARLSNGRWPAANTFAKWMLRPVLRDGIRHGVLIIDDADGEHIFGESSRIGKDCGIARLRILSEDFWLRIYLRHDLGFSEAYMSGDFETPNLKAILDLWLDNRRHLVGLNSIFGCVMSGLSAVALRLLGQTLSNAKLNVIAGYDCCNELFEAFLGDTMMYSSALFSDSTGGVRGDLDIMKAAETDLDSAQLHKTLYILRKARVRPGHRLLEFGTGWGTMAIEAAKMGCRVDTLTLSIKQKRWAEAKIARLDLQDSIRIHLLDYRRLPPEFEKVFDAFVSVEMVEHVGYRYLPKYFEIIDWALKPDCATVVVTATTQPDSRFTTLQPNDFARKYIWPNAFCPSPITLADTANQATKSGFDLDSIENYTHHYPRTLREWSNRFQRNWDDKLISAIVKAQPQLSNPENLAIYKRRWEYMFAYAEVGFARAYTSMTYWTFVRPENIVEPCS